jgi:transcriptional regulator with XRE-family HTH domain
MALRLVTSKSADVQALVASERRIFAAQLRAARAILGWSQSELALRAGLTQRAVHKLEQGETEPRRATVHAIEEIWRQQGIGFEATADSGFRLTVSDAVLNRAQSAPEHALRFDAGVTARQPKPRPYRLA